MTTEFQPITLSGTHVRVVPLSHEHHADLVEATNDGELWKLWYTNIPEPSLVQSEIDRRMALQEKSQMIPFAVIDQSSGKAVGMTNYMNIDTANRRLEIGGTWYRKSVQRTALNTDCKLILLTHAFEHLQCIAVEFRTSFFNQSSRRAIERIGAKLDGILRNHMVMPNGTLRDSCVYSIIQSEWPAVKANLQYELSRTR